MMEKHGKWASRFWDKPISSLMIYHDIVYPCTREWLDFTRITLHVEGVSETGILTHRRNLPEKLRSSVCPLSVELCFFVVWVRLLLCCLRHCLRNAYAATVGAYAAHPFEGVPTQAQRPRKATPQCRFLPTPSHFCLLLEGWKRNFCLRDHSPIHIFAARAPRLQSAHRHLAATPMCSSRTSNQVPKRTLNIWWINHDKSLKTQLVTFDYAGVKPSDVFDCR